MTYWRYSPHEQLQGIAAEKFAAIVNDAWSLLPSIVASSVALYREVAERLFVDEGNVKRYETRLVFDTVKIGLTLPTRQSPRRRKRTQDR